MYNPPSLTPQYEISGLAAGGSCAACRGAGSGADRRDREKEQRSAVRWLSGQRAPAWRPAFPRSLRRTLRADSYRRSSSRNTEASPKNRFGDQAASTGSRSSAFPMERKNWVATR